MCRRRSASDAEALLSSYRETADSGYAEKRRLCAAHSRSVRARNRLSFLPTNRRTFIRLAATAGVAALAADTMLLEPNRPRIVRREVALPRWPAGLEGFTVALLSDFHYDPYFSVHPLRSAISMVNSLQPALIVLTGDFVSIPFAGKAAMGAAAAEPCAQLLRQMHAPYGLWAVLGNHDIYTDSDRVTSSLRTEGIQVLVNQSVPIESNEARFWLAGVDDVLGGTPTSALPCIRFLPTKPPSCWFTNRTMLTTPRAIPSISNSQGIPMEARCDCRS